jgi:hypothetical protein
MLLALLAAGAAGCGGRSDDLPIHLIDDPKIRRDVPFVAWGEVVSLDGEPRQVLSSVPPLVPPTEILPAARGRAEGPRTDPGELPAPCPGSSTKRSPRAATRCACCGRGP